MQDEKIYQGMGDEEALKRVMQNILKNCLQYALEEVSVSIEEWKEEQKKEGSKLKISVANPIAADCEIDVEQVFERFFVGSEKRQSAGLGLSIVKLLVEKMQGQVFAMKENNIFYVGFYLTMP